ncbi:MAG: chorismate synthase [Caldisphaeraceae archaeon]|nr:chorismate synthase [Caldisphaeraceae archaeon]
MPGNSFGTSFRITTFGESHGNALGVVMDGLPAGLKITPHDIEYELYFRRPGKEYTSQRLEEDKVEILSGLFNGKTTGSPLAVIVKNVDVDSTPYESMRFTPRPGHADLPFILKYGIENWDYRGGGRASGRETVSRVIAGSIAKKLLLLKGTYIFSCIRSLGMKEISGSIQLHEVIKAKCRKVRACKMDYEKEFEDLLYGLIRSGDSVGAVVETRIVNPPIGLGEPVFDKIKADLAKAVMSIPGVVGFEYGLGFEASKKRGSDILDEIVLKGKRVGLRNNFSGGILGGITTGEEIVFRSAFKPTSSIKRPQKTLDIRLMEERTIIIEGRHDPCIAIRGTSVVEAMAAVVLLDHSITSHIIPSDRLSDEDSELIERRWEGYKRLCMPMAGSQY